MVTVTLTTYSVSELALASFIAQLPTYLDAFSAHDTGVIYHGRDTRYAGKEICFA